MIREELEHVLAAVLDVGEMMLTSGAEVNRVENTIQRMMQAYGCNRVDVFTIPSNIVVSVQTMEEVVLTQTRRIANYETDMYKIERCNALSRRVCADPPTLQELKNVVEEIKQEKGYSRLTKLITYGVISAAFSVFFGGTWLDGVAAFVCGLLLYVSVEACGRLKVQRIILNILCSAIVGLGAVLLTSLGIGQSVDKIIIGNIMLLIPGIALTSSVRDMISGDTVSGMLGLCEALIRALAIAAGFALVLWQFPV